MSPERSPKRQKVSPVGAAPDRASAAQEHSSGKGSTETPQKQPQKQPQNTSWYGSWSRKASPVIKTAHESVRAVSTSALETPSVDTTKPKSLRSPSLAMALGKKNTDRALPISATMTKVNAEAANSARERPKKLETEVADTSKSGEDISAPNKEPEATEGTTKPHQQESKDQGDSVGQTAQRSSWLGWLAKNDQPSELTSVGSPAQIPEETQLKDQDDDKDPKIDDKPPPEPEEKNKTQRASWLPWASASSNSQVEELSKQARQSEENSSGKPEDGKQIPHDLNATVRIDLSEDKSTAKPLADTDALPPQPLDLPHDATKASAWAFWSRERKVNSSSSSVDKPHEGEIAISDTPSQVKPKRASISVPKSDTAATTATTTQKNLENKLEDTKAGSTQAINRSSQIPVNIANLENISVAVQETPAQKQLSSHKATKGYQNVLLPELESTLKLPDQPSIIQQLARLLHITKEPEMKHLSLVKEPPKIRNALAIGVHGYFPAPLIRTVIGQPTGTSIKFADMAAKSIKRFTASRGYDCQVKTAALEGEGRISERVDLLWKLLLNWIDEIRKSDFILVACHSQGVPVAIMLVAKLVQFGCLNNARVGICAMAGVNMGPFSEYKSRWISGSAGELFEFSKPESKVSEDYFAALEVVVKFGIRVTLIGSIDDQLVSLESSIFSSVSHPHIYRAVSIDARAHAPNFLSHLVGFALKLRNLGVQDHGLIRELSSPLAGSLYTGEGHSRLYESDNCYDLAVGWSLLTTTMTEAPLVRNATIAGPSNPYILPFAMRGLLEEEFVRTELQGETSELLKQFDEWKPITKVLKDVKFRLEGIRSKL